MIRFSAICPKNFPVHPGDPDILPGHIPFWTYSPRTFHPPRQFSPLLHGVGHFPFHHHHPPPPIYNVKRSTINVYKIGSGRSVMVRNTSQCHFSKDSPSSESDFRLRVRIRIPRRGSFRVMIPSRRSVNIRCMGYGLVAFFKNSQPRKSVRIRIKVRVRTQRCGSVKVRSMGQSQFSKKSPPHESVRVRIRVRVRTPRRGSVRVRTMGSCHYSNFRFNRRGTCPRWVEKMSGRGKTAVVQFSKFQLSVPCTAFSHHTRPVRPDLHHGGDLAALSSTLSSKFILTSVILPSVSRRSQRTGGLQDLFVAHGRRRRHVSRLISAERADARFASSAH